MPHVGYSSIICEDEQKYQAMRDKETVEAKALRQKLDESLARNEAFIKDSRNRKALFEQFAPNYYFHKDETSFPMRVEDYVRDVVMAKYNYYRAPKRPLTEEQKKELDLIIKYFVTPDGKFNGKYRDHANQPEFQELLPTQQLIEERDSKWAIERYKELSEAKTSLSNSDQEEKRTIEQILCKQVDGKFEIDQAKFDERGFIRDFWNDDIQKHIFHSGDSQFLTFDEKEFGFKLGSKVPIEGSRPGRDQAAPAYVNIIATPDGVYMKYNRFYALSDTIPGTKWLYNLLPNKWCKKCKSFALHAGDWEGVGVKVKIDEEGKATLHGLQSFAHGRDGARYVELDKLTLDKENGHPVCFVGVGTHGTYLEDIVGRSKFADVTGSHIKERPTEFVDISADNKQILQQDWARTFQRTGSPGPSAPPNFGGETHRDYKAMLEDSLHWNRYKPISILRNFIDRIKGFFKKEVSSKPLKDSIRLPGTGDKLQASAEYLPPQYGVKQTKDLEPRKTSPSRERSQSLDLQRSNSTKKHRRSSSWTQTLDSQTDGSRTAKQMRS